MLSNAGPSKKISIRFSDCGISTSQLKNEVNKQIRKSAIVNFFQLVYLGFIAEFENITSEETPDIMTGQLIKAQNG